MSHRKTKLDWQIEQNRQDLAGKQADALVARLGLMAPINPFDVIKSESRFLRAGGRHFGNRFDGKLKFSREKNRFLLFFNTKYDAGLVAGRHHPRTRFSIAHELGHYFIEPHHQNLRRGGPPHPSSSEYRTESEMEREADAFASSLLLPTDLIKHSVNEGELTLERLNDLAMAHETSLVSTTIRSVRLSHFPCAVAGIRGGRVAWVFPSEKLIDAGCFPGKKSLDSATAREQWKMFEDGGEDWGAGQGIVSDWFQLFGDGSAIADVFVTEQYMPVQIMKTLVVLLTLDEDDLPVEKEEEDEDDKLHRERFGF